MFNRLNNTETYEAATTGDKLKLHRSCNAPYKIEAVTIQQKNGHSATLPFEFLKEVLEFVGVIPPGTP